SKWLVIALYGALIVWKHDAEALWVAMGCAINSWLGIALKHILNHERPILTLRSDPGMPSSHSQSIFFGVLYVILLMVKCVGLNGNTVFAVVLTLCSGSYLSWLRVSHKLHTISQVLVGAVLGAMFSVLWFQAWYAFVLRAFAASLGVRIAVLLGTASIGVCFLLYIFRNGFAEKL
ncbi:Lipid phosphate phosphatase epsilon 2 protein, partial [Thalictrum thalictroides]